MLATGQPESNHNGDDPAKDELTLPPSASIFLTLTDPPIEMYPDVLQYREGIRQWKQASASVFDLVWKTGT
jgi:hypothetical protein